MKTYTFQSLLKLAKEQEFKMACLLSPQGEKVVPFNPYKKNGSNLEPHFATMQKRLKAEHYPDGVYHVQLAYNINDTRNPKSFPITKGKVNPEELAEAEKKSMPLTPVTIVEKHENVLTWDGALKLQQEISDLKTQVAKLQMELNAAHLQLEEYEDQEEEQSLSEQPQSGLFGLLEKLVPSLMPVVDKHFELEERRLNLEEMKLAGGGRSNAQPKKGIDIPIIPGSQEHLNLIEYYFRKGPEEKMNVELDKLEAANSELYAQVLERLNLVEESGTAEGEEEPQ